MSDTNDQPRPRIIIEFDGPNSANFSAHMEGGVTPTQIYLACHFIGMQAEDHVRARVMSGTPEAPPTIVPVRQDIVGPEPRSLRRV